MALSTIFRFLVGQRGAIQTVASSRHTIWLGLVFVLAAGVAREYDGEDLVREPWHLLLPLGASLATSLILFLMLWLPVRPKPKVATFHEAYRSFLSVYWMTAPLALFYAIPVERFLTAAGSTAANLWLLLIVAVWRVVLMVRATSVLFHCSFWSTLPVVMLFADTVTLFILYWTPLPIFAIMGGIRLTESESMIQGAACAVGFWGAVSWPVWLIAAIVVWVRKRLSAAEYPVPLEQERFPAAAWVFAVASILILIPFLPATQREQRLRREVESAMKSGKVATGLKIMSDRKPEDFPPHWDPPPRFGYGEWEPPAATLLLALLDTPADPWVTELFLVKLAQVSLPWHEWPETIRSLNSDQFDRFLALLEQHQDQRDILFDFQNALQEQLKEEAKRTETQQLRIRKLLALVNVRETMNAQETLSPSR